MSPSREEKPPTHRKVPGVSNRKRSQSSAKRAQPKKQMGTASSATSRTSATSASNPRLSEAQRLMQRAEAKVSQKKGKHSPRRRRAQSSSLFSLRWVGRNFAHALGLSVALTFAALAAAWCYYLLNVMFVAGQAVALPTGVICAAALSYASAYYLAAVEVASEGGDEVEAMPFTEWREWFWTLPSTIGMFLIACFVGYGIGLLLPFPRAVVILVTAFVLYPYLQLSTMESGSALAPYSGLVTYTVFRYPVHWFVFYLQAAIVVGALWALGSVVWRDPPFATVLIMGPFVAIGVVVYARVLGRLAWRLRKASTS